ncbi:MAG: glycosyltransferase family 39 protein, partial [Patescibacteria group bacterium]|nr:glycosyltransferase family 39 protein [Patescibacteria group bacterium]
MLKSKQSIILLAGFILGLAARLFLLRYPAMHDIDAYSTWGNNVLSAGLAHGFRGIYFPIQYQIFAFCSWLVEITGWDVSAVFKFISLFFDAGNFILLTLILKNLKCNKLFALLYWLHPWFVAIFTAGYIDCQFVFFVLLTLYILLQGKSRRNYFWAGLPLGIAFLMKPQAQMLIFAVFIFALVGYIRRRKFDQFLILAAPAILFLGYELYFSFSLFATMGFKAIILLPRKYLAIQGVMAVLTGNMLNIWYPIAYFMKQPGAPIYSVG